MRGHDITEQPSRVRRAGLGGRRVLVSRKWSGKTLTEHRADRASVVRQVLQAAGVEAPEADRLYADVLHEDGQPRFVWDDLAVTEADYTEVLVASVMPLPVFVPLMVLAGAAGASATPAGGRPLAMPRRGNPPKTCRRQC